MVPKGFFQAPLPEDVLDSSPTASEILIPDPDLGLSLEERAAKRRRILEHGNNVLRGTPPILLSTVLKKGPLQGWHNPWKPQMDTRQPDQCPSDPPAKPSYAVRKGAKTRRSVHLSNNQHEQTLGMDEQHFERPEWLRRIPLEKPPIYPDVASPSARRQSAQASRSSPPHASSLPTSPTVVMKRVVGSASPSINRQAAEAQAGCNPQHPAICQHSALELSSPIRLRSHPTRRDRERSEASEAEEQREFTTINEDWSATNPRCPRVHKHRSINPEMGTKSAKQHSPKAWVSAHRQTTLDASEHLVGSFEYNRRSVSHHEDPAQPSQAPAVQPPFGQQDTTSHDLSPPKDDWRRAEKWTGQRSPPVGADDDPEQSMDARPRRVMRKSGGIFYGEDGCENAETTSDQFSSTQPMSTNEIRCFQEDSRTSPPNRQDSRDYPLINQRDPQPALMIVQGAFLDLIPPEESGESRDVEEPRRMSNGAAITPFRDFDTPPLGSQAAPMSSQDLAGRLTPLAQYSQTRSNKRASLQLPDRKARSQPPQPHESDTGADRQRSSKSNEQTSLNRLNRSPSHNQGSFVHPESDHSKPLFGSYVPSVQPAQVVMDEFELNSALDEAGSFLGTWNVNSTSSASGSIGPNIRSALKVTKP